MHEILKQSNLDLLREIDQLKLALNKRFKDRESSKSLPELVPYYKAVDKACDQMRVRAENILHYLDYQQKDILTELLSETQEVSRLFHLYNLRLLSPLL